MIFLLKTLSLTIAIFLGMTLHWGVKTVVEDYILQKAMKEFEQARIETKRKAEEERKALETRTRQELEEARREQLQAAVRKMRLSEIQKKKNQTCNYWIEQYQGHRSGSNKAYRDVACRDAGRPFN